MLGGRDVDAVFIKPLEEGQQVRAGLVALLGDALLIVRDAQRRLDEEQGKPDRDVAHGGA